MAKTKALIGLMVVLAIMPVAMAENATPISASNESPEINGDLDTITIPAGAVVRFLQLERQLGIKIERAEYIISQLDNASTADLETIVGELTLIKEEVSQYTDESAFEGMTVPEIGVLFIDLKNDSMTLIREFKNILHDIVGEQERERLREEVQVMNGSPEGLTAQIRNKLHEYNAERVRRMLQDMSIDNETIIQQVLNGTLNKGQIMNRIRTAYAGLESDKVLRARLKLVEESNKASILRRAAVEQARKNIEERKQARLTERIEKAEAKTNNVWGRVKEKLNQKVNENRGNGRGQSE
jgi:hypothetical protein